MFSLFDSIYNYFGYNVDESVKPETMRARNEMLKQIRNSKIKLKPLTRDVIIYKQINPYNYLKKKTKKEKEKK